MDLAADLLSVIIKVPEKKAFAISGGIIISSSTEHLLVAIARSHLEISLFITAQ